MRILQLIDSLEPGGAEMVAVQYANHLVSTEVDSYLCASRKEGLLKEQINKDVGFIFLKRKHTLDLFALTRLLRFCKNEKIELIHAHASSFFLAFLVKLFKPKMRVVWHDHYGDSENLDKRPFKMLSFASRNIDTIISVNTKLKNWAASNLKCERVKFLSNAVNINIKSEEGDLKLNGEAEYRIICLANFRAQKDHSNLLEAFEIVAQAVPKASLHLIGKNWNDAYFKQITEQMKNSVNADKIHYYGAQFGVAELLVQATIGVLSSQSEGLPMALLEYGASGLGVITTNVGECMTVIDNSAYCVSPRSPEALAKAIITLLTDPNELETWKKTFSDRIAREYSIQAIIPKLKTIYNYSLKEAQTH